jgi:PIN domain nuclease of toxin-antitoxin system
VKLLLDTHILIWAAISPQRLSADARDILNDPQNDLIFSVVSLWEIGIKSALGRSDFRVDARLLRRNLVDNGYEELPIAAEHALAIGNLPMIHKDPFDRLLIAQALIEGVTLLTSDPLVALYPGAIRKL